ncbi:MAG: Mur ligase family protein [Bacteroidales bacterium]|jgi:UDP-N-acetylmuramate: L-alanyl-gamma-D-glutamyl-meso-diaminopimelate ligase
MRIHLIATGGSVMHNLAIALHKKGYSVTGSDDEIFEPAKSHLDKYGLLPKKWGWFPENITKDIDVVILGMHARGYNPELLQAQKLNLKIYSFPEYIYEQSKEKMRVVIGGSHGKTTITSMIMHVLNYHKVDFDYMVGSQLEGFDTMVKLTEKAPFIILEGDEYLSSAIDRRPKFHLYKPQLALLSGIAWDHINVFPTFENYIEQFRIFIEQIDDGRTLVYCKTDENVVKLVDEIEKPINKFSYGIPEYVIKNGITYIIRKRKEIPLKIFGKHNLQNLNGARVICNQLGIDDMSFYEAMQLFKGAAKRLELVCSNDKTIVYKDFAHSPSKLKATIDAVKEQFPDKIIVACMELHTFSSLSSNFLSGYDGSMNKADEAIVYFNPHTIEHKKLPALTSDDIKKSFNKNNLLVFNDSVKLGETLVNSDKENKIFLLMSSGNFDGIDFEELGKKLTSQ